MIAHSEVVELVFINSDFLLEFVALVVEMVNIAELSMFFLVTLDFF
jgi:hypothetical protein